MFAIFTTSTYFILQWIQRKGPGVEDSKPNNEKNDVTKVYLHPKMYYLNGVIPMRVYFVQKQLLVNMRKKNSVNRMLLMNKRNTLLTASGWG